MRHPEDESEETIKTYLDKFHQDAVDLESRAIDETLSDERRVCLLITSAGNYLNSGYYTRGLINLEVALGLLPESGEISDSLGRLVRYAEGFVEKYGKRGEPKITRSRYVTKENERLGPDFKNLLKKTLKDIDYQDFMENEKDVKKIIEKTKEMAAMAYVDVFERRYADAVEKVERAREMLFDKIPDKPETYDAMDELENAIDVIEVAREGGQKDESRLMANRFIETLYMKE
jgi:hypothetical protein